MLLRTAIFVLALCSRKWVGGEIIQALAYDVPIPGYKTKNTINLRLWEAKASCEDFNLFQFNGGQYESAAQLHSKAQQVCCTATHMTHEHCHISLILSQGEP